MDENYVSDNCSVSIDGCEMVFTCKDSISAELFKNKLINMMGEGIIPSMTIKDMLSQGERGIQHDIYLKRRLSNEDIMEDISRELGVI